MYEWDWSSDVCSSDLDDVSIDDTERIVKNYASKDSRIVWIDNEGESLGVAKNFIRLLDYSDAPFCLFCDQDDIWFPEKVKVMIDAISVRDQSIPQVAFSNAKLWNPESGVLSERNTLTYPKSFKDLLFLNTGIQGAASIFNAAAREVMRVPLTYYAMHDHVLVLTGLGLGEVSYLDRALFYYRQHDSNVTGNAPGSLMKKALLSMSENRHIPVVDGHHYRGLKAFYDVHGNGMRAEDCEVIELFLALPNYNAVQRFYKVAHHRYRIFEKSGLLLLKMCLRPYYG